MKRTIIIFLLVLFFIMDISCTEKSSISSEAEVDNAAKEKSSIPSEAEAAKAALVLAIEDCMQVKKLTLYKNIESMLIAVPINKQIIEYSVKFRAISESFDNFKTTRLLDEAYKRYINGDRLTIALFTINSGLERDAFILFSGFKDCYLSDENNSKYSPFAYTRTFEEKQRLGITRGYVHFKSPRMADSDSYSIHLPYLCYYSYDSASPKCKRANFVIDNTDIGYLSLLKNGINEDDIRKQYGIRPYVQEGIDYKFFMDIFNLVIGVLSLL